MGIFLSKIILFFNRNKLFYFGILASISIFLFSGITRLNLDENIYGIFPKGEQFEKFNDVLKKNSLNKQVIFSINTSGKEYEEVYESLEKVSQEIITETTNLLADVVVFRDDQQENVLNHYYTFFPAYLDSSDYQKIDVNLNTDSISSAIDKVSEQLSSPNSLFLRKILAKDPLGLMWPKLKAINPQLDSSNYSVEDGILYSSEHDRAFFTAVLDFEINDNIKNNELNQKLDSLTSRYSEFDLDYFGTFRISHENAVQVKKDTSLTIMISIGLILLLLIAYYRSLFTPIFFILPALFSGFCGLGILGYIDPNISAISIATSAVLMGIVLDYAFHFMTHYSHTGSLTKTVQQLSFPMLVGSFTTIAAFSALLFTDSVVLQNFGLLALLTLSSAAIFTLIFLPTLIHITGFKVKTRTGSKKFKLPKWITKIAVFLTLIIAVMFIIKRPAVEFDSDLNNLSYHTDELIEKEDYYTGINPVNEKKLHFFIEGKTKEEAIERNFQLFQKLVRYHEEFELEEIVSVGSYLIPNSILEGKQNDWEQFWENKINPTYSKINEAGANHDFSDKAFSPFKTWIEKTDISQLSTNEKLIEDLGISKLVYTSDNEWNITTSVVVDRSKVEHLKQEMNDVEGLYIFDFTEMASVLMLTVQKDFNYLLLFSSLIVLLSLLVIYGRIELALFSFFPMLVSWIWILYIASWLDIPFNFINIIVATFIFGLGDDFSIFVTDGLIQKYKTNASSLSSYKSAIVLSGVTTIVGTGALYFAKHPAIHSIAIISVVGIGCILLVTLFVQPAIFNFFVTKRTDKKRSPITLLGLFMSTFLFSTFLIGCILLNVIILFLFLIPVSKVKKRSVVNFIISKMTKTIIYVGFHLKKKYVNFDKVDFSKPSLIVANHSSFLDILVLLMLNPKTIIMVKSWVYNSPIFGAPIRYAGFVFVQEGHEQNLDIIQERINEGYSIVIFPEGTRSADGLIHRFHKGAFFLAKELNIDIQPILISGAHYINPKNDFIIKSGTVTITALPRLKADSPKFEQRFGLLTKSVAESMRETDRLIHKEHYNSEELRNRVMYNYLYKNPITEWYVRIKWRFEKSNFELYDSLIQNRQKIYDIGCGLGYLGYYLHYRDSSRIIKGIDYDEEKIALAQNGHDKSENLSFEHGDIRSLSVEKPEVVFFNDVLHYMQKEQQFEVLKNTLHVLTQDGIIFIRDGITDLNDRHNKTKKTEKYSTQIVNFNKTTNDLSFFSSEDIFKFAKENGASCEMVQQSKKTSNVLFILRKN